MDNAHFLLNQQKVSLTAIDNFFIRQQSSLTAYDFDGK